MSFYGWKPYVPVAERRRKAEKAAAKARKAGADLSPVAASRGAITKTFWGKAWSENLERYSDYANRLPRGRTYVRNGSVIDLKITEGEVQAQVMGSSLYKVAVRVAAVAAKHWQSIGADCAGSIDSLVELLQGKLSRAVMERICTPNTGLFPTPKEISFSCSCPDWASMCKHVAAVLYGVGARLDEQPELIFRLRRVDAKELVSQAGAGLPKSTHAPAAGKVLDDALLADVFGIEMAEVAPAKQSAAPRDKPAAKVAKPPAKAAARTTRKAPTGGRTEATKEAVAAQGRAKAELPALASVGSRKSGTNSATASHTKTAGGTVRPKSTAVTTRRLADQVTKDAMATQVIKRPAKAATATTREAPAFEKNEAAKKTVAGQRPVKANAPVKTASGTGKSTTRIVAASKAKTASATKRPKKTALTTGSVAGRLAKDKSR